MVYYTKRENKSGTVYRLHVKIYVPEKKNVFQASTTFVPPSGMSPAKAEKEAHKAAYLFEEEKRKEILGSVNIFPMKGNSRSTSMSLGAI